MALTTEQERLKKRAQRAKARAAAGDSGGDSNVRSILSAPANSPVEFKVFESVEAAVREEIKSLPLAASRPTEVSRAIALAKILDDRSAANRVGAADKLGTVMEALRGGGSVVANPLRNLRDRRTAG